MNKSVKVPTKVLEGRALDYTVARLEGTDYRYMKTRGGDYNGEWWWDERSYSDRWSLAGPIIERERIEISPTDDLMEGEEYTGRSGWFAGVRKEGHILGNGSSFTSPLVAAMRAYVQYRLGDTVRVPKELVCTAPKT